MDQIIYHNAERDIAQILKNEKKNPLQQVVDYLYNTFSHYSWVGIYILKGKILYLGPWNGVQATEHTKIPIGKGICGAAAKTGKTEVISDVKGDDRYLACFLSTKAEIVIPIKYNNKILGELDIDSDTKNSFKDQDILFLEKITDMLIPHISNL